MPELGTYGSVRGVPGNGHPYRDHSGTYPLSHLYGHFGLVRLTARGRDVAWVKA